MKRLTARFATTHVDRHGDRMPLSALESWVESISHQYLPVLYNHDPRVPPIGRVVSAKIVALDDGEYALEGDFELFEPGDRLNDGSLRTIPTRVYESDKLQLTFDMNYLDIDDQEQIAEICDVIGTQPLFEYKKALEPISILTIGGLFLLNHIFSEFLKRLGADGYELLKAKLKKLMTRRKEGESDKILRFAFVIEDHGYIFDVDVIMTNPSEDDIESFFTDGIKNIDEVLTMYYKRESNPKRLAFEYVDDCLEYRFAVRQDGIPMFPQKSDAARTK